MLVTAVGGDLATRAAALDASAVALRPAADGALRALGPAPDEGALRRFVSAAPGLSTIPVQAGDVAVAVGRSGSRTHSVTTADGALYRVRVVPVGAQPGAALLVGRPLAGTRQIRRALALALLVFGVVAVATAVVVGRRVARAGVAPVRELIAEVEQRAAEDDLTL